MAVVLMADRLCVHSMQGGLVRAGGDQGMVSADGPALGCARSDPRDRFVNYTRYGLYYTPSPGPFATAGASWLGWDIDKGEALGEPDLSLVSRPRRYGFHATLKAPFTLASGTTPQELEDAVSALCAKLSPVVLAGLEVSRLGSFLALTPLGDPSALKVLAARCVTDLDRFRAPLTEAERQRKTKPKMTPQLRQNLERWGYPHAMESFRFHMTLTGPLDRSSRQAAARAAKSHFAPCLPKPFSITSLSLAAEAPDGMFHLIRRFDLVGPA
ncbi:DUF1045 domain-containing protein [Roseobacter weihaiensis]|uniref:DUF1045 domain-containing protein n=1 Tax=Roseobacter weihaiensis TaxID=2763262 RepID=UPI001D0B47D6|nr:DUF1045 domain-containing protein [Roseobacter sp. H9]